MRVACRSEGEKCQMSYFLRSRARSANTVDIIPTLRRLNSDAPSYRNQQVRSRVVTPPTVRPRNAHKFLRPIPSLALLRTLLSRATIYHGARQRPDVSCHRFNRAPLGLSVLVRGRARRPTTGRCRNTRTAKEYLTRVEPSARVPPPTPVIFALCTDRLSPTCSKLNFSCSNLRNR